MLTESVGGPPGYQIFYRFSLHLLLYGLCCLDEKKFPALNRCRDALAPHFLTPAYDNEWLVFFWIFCDFPLTNEGGTTVLDHFDDFMAKEASGLSKVNREHVGQFVAQLKASRLGFYQEISSTSKTTKFRELQLIAGSFRHRICLKSAASLRFRLASRIALKSNRFGGRYGKARAVAMDSDVFEHRAVHAICLTASGGRIPRAITKTEFACDFQLHLAVAVHGLSMEGTADRDRSGRPS